MDFLIVLIIVGISAVLVVLAVITLLVCCRRRGKLKRRSKTIIVRSVSPGLIIKTLHFSHFRSAEPSKYVYGTLGTDDNDSTDKSSDGKTVPGPLYQDPMSLDLLTYGTMTRQSPPVFAEPPEPICKYT